MVFPVKRNGAKKGMKNISRREALFGIGALLAAACSRSKAGTMFDDSAGLKDDGRLLSRPGKPSKPALEPGSHYIDVVKGRTAIAYVPKGFDGAKPTAFLLALHGATLSVESPIRALQQAADESKVVLLSPKSADYTWDMGLGGFGTDVDFVDKCLAWMFDRFSIDTKRLGIGGFSDGASYALTLGVGNGDLFGHVIAYSPGYMAPIKIAGKPRIFISHGTRDQILPIEKCGRRLAAELKSRKYDVTYQEFDGPHTVPPDIAKQSFNWLSA